METPNVALNPGEYQITHADAEMIHFNVHWITTKGVHEGILLDYSALFPTTRLLIAAGYVDQTVRLQREQKERMTKDGTN